MPSPDKMVGDACEEFLKVAPQFKLGRLDTERPHPDTINLSTLARDHLPGAIACLKAVDGKALFQLQSYADKIAQMGSDIKTVLRRGNRVFLGGCGATGRLAIALEVFCREGMMGDPFQDQVIGFMAGGDAALIKSIENFEDRPSFGKRQLFELGFSEDDLFIGITEGGETPYVIGATEAAARHSHHNPWFLYCNPDDQLTRLVERSASILRNKRIGKLNLHVGPMALSGSTRMQASTVQMAAVGWALMYGPDRERVLSSLVRLRQFWDELDIAPMADFTALETRYYGNNEYVLYQTKSCGVTVLTDTTERSPTFSLSPFENNLLPGDSPSLSYLTLPQAHDPASAWRGVLKRSPRCLEWPEIAAYTGEKFFYGFNLDSDCEKRRRQKTGSPKHHRFIIESTDGGIRWNLGSTAWDITTGNLGVLEKNLILKMLLNIHSTLVMGKLGRFESNLMTYVKPSNFKLIDRSIRYVRLLAKHRNIEPPGYREVARRLFEVRETMGPDDPIVLKVLERL